jgi:hypothetical protein
MIFVNPYSRVNCDVPNLSLAYCATILGAAKIVDFNTAPRNYDILLEQPTDLLGISLRSLNIAEAERIAAAYRIAHPQTRIASVGCGIDIQCCYPFRSWSDHLSYNETFSDQYPFPNYELFDSFPTFHQNWRANKWRYVIMTSLGCPFPCMHCMCKNRPWLARSPQNCYEELKRAQTQWGIVSFLIIDDCFNVNIQRAIEFCRLIKPLGLHFECANGLRADLFTTELAQSLAEAGCIQASFGIESTDDVVLRNIHKKESFAQISAAVHIAKQHFKHVNGFFIIGLPGSSYESDRRSLAWANEIGINAHFSYYVPQGLELPDNEVFYGEGARPLSDSYAHEDQIRIYLETSSMRPVVPKNVV